MNKVYSRINWENEPSDKTPINETNMNKMDFALNEIDNRLIEQDTIKLSKTDASNDIVNWTMDEDTGVITVTRRSGEKIIFDLNIEKIPVSFSLTSYQNNRYDIPDPYNIFCFPPLSSPTSNCLFRHKFFYPYHSYWC